MFESARCHKTGKVLKNALWKNVYQETTQVLFDRMNNYTEHLGNIRLRYAKDPEAESGLKILEEDHYYPFGLKHKGYNNEHNIFYPPIGTPNKVVIIPITPDSRDPYKYKYNGKEFQDELGLDWYDYGARNYDASLGRWMNVDPHADNYFSVNPYSSFANNPISFIDPTGKDILFWRFNSDGDGGGDWEQVGYGQLDKKSQKGISNFAQTKSGKEFLSLFANKGDKIGDIEFTENGKYAKHNWNFGEYSSYVSGALGTTPKPIIHSVFGPTKDKGKSASYIDFYTHLNTLREDNSNISFAGTIGHEVFLHLTQYLDNFIEAFENNGEKSARAIYNQNVKNNYKGYKQHFSMANKTKTSQAYYSYMNQLKSVFNPKDVQKYIKIQRKKNLESAKKQKAASKNN